MSMHSETYLISLKYFYSNEVLQEHNTRLFQRMMSLLKVGGQSYFYINSLFST